MLRRVLLGMGLVFAMATHAMATPPDHATIGKLAREELSSRRYQKDLPGRTAPPPSTKGPVRDRTDPDPAREVGREDSRPEDSPGFTGLSLPFFFARILMWIFVCVIAVAVTLFLLASLRGRGAGAPKVFTGTLATGNSAPAAPAPPTRLEELDAMAAAGRFDEAVHGLMLLAFDHLRRRDVLPRGEELTARELSEQSSLPDPVRPAVRRMVLGTEQARFALHPLDGTAWTECRAACMAVLGAGGRVAS